MASKTAASRAGMPLSRRYYWPALARAWVPWLKLVMGLFLISGWVMVLVAWQKAEAGRAEYEQLILASMNGQTIIWSSPEDPEVVVLKAETLDIGIITKEK